VTHFHVQKNANCATFKETTEVRPRRAHTPGDQPEHFLLLRHFNVVPDCFNECDRGLLPTRLGFFDFKAMAETTTGLQWYKDTLRRTLNV
jgi:hypothetical protein